MPLRFGGDMDDPHNPASPFMAKPDVEAMAEEMLGRMGSNEERANALEISFIDMWVGTHLREPNDPTPLAKATLFNKAAIKRIWEVRELLRLSSAIDDHIVTQADMLLSEMIPPGYGEPIGG